MPVPLLCSSSVDQMLGTGDPAVLAAVASGFRSLASYVPPPGCNTSQSSNSSASTGDAAASAAIDDAIRATAKTFCIQSCHYSRQTDPQGVQQVGKGI